MATCWALDFVDLSQRLVPAAIVVVSNSPSDTLLATKWLQTGSERGFAVAYRDAEPCGLLLMRILTRGCGLIAMNLLRFGQSHNSGLIMARADPFVHSSPACQLLLRKRF